jgi:hypothetical protein
MFGPSCGTGLGCAVAVDHATGMDELGVTICTSVGAAALGAACMGNVECASGMCFVGHCVAPCNATHPCATGTCTTLMGFDPSLDLGYCPT